MNASVKVIFSVGLRNFCCQPKYISLLKPRRLMVNLPRNLSSPSTSSLEFETPSSVGAVKYLNEIGVKNPKLLKDIENIPVLSSGGPDAWKNVIISLEKFGVNIETVAKIVVRNPVLLQLTPQRISFAWTIWLDCCHERELVQSLITLYPEFLNLKRDHVHERFDHLKAVTGSTKFTVDVLKRSPQIMYRSMSELQKVSDYLSEVMVVRNASEYYKSAALGVTFKELATRHVFLERCGKYRTPKLKQSETIPTGNPTLTQIYDTTDKEFATKVAGLTLEEFVVFQSMFETEMDVEETDSDSGSDSD